MAAEEKLHSMWCLVWVRRGKGIDHNGGLLALELIHGSCPGSRDAAADLRNLCVVRRNDEDVIETYRSGFAKPVGPGHAWCHQSLDDLGNALGLFRRAVLVALVLHGQIKKARPREWRGAAKNLYREAWMGYKLPLVKQI